MTKHNTYFFLQNFLQDFFNCQNNRAYSHQMNDAFHANRITSGKLFIDGFPLRIWWAYLDLNQGPRPYQGRALTS